jgi:hypothetical protein
MANDPGRGSVTRPPNDGTLIFDNPGKDSAYDVRGDPKALSDAGVNTGMSPGAPVWLNGMSTDGDAINRVGGFNGEADSDPMFDRFKPELSSMSDIDANCGTGSEAPEAVSHVVLSGADSDPEFERYPNASSQEDEGTK